MEVLPRSMWVRATLLRIMRGMSDTKTRNRCQRKTAIAAMVCGSAVIVAPLVLALVAMAGPVGSTVSNWHFVANVSELPADGAPVRFVVERQNWDAWTRLPDTQVGAVFVRREPTTGDITALRTYHSKLGIAVAFNECEQVFESTCWNAVFSLNGRYLGESADIDDIEQVDSHVVDDRVYVKRF